MKKEGDPLLLQFSALIKPISLILGSFFTALQSLTYPGSRKPASFFSPCPGWHCAPPVFPEAVKKIRQREIGGGRACPGKGQIHDTKTGTGFSVAGVVFNPLKPSRESSFFYKNTAKLPASLRGIRGSASRASISRWVLAASISPFPGQRERLFSPSIRILSQLPSRRG
jgi:hypothetical protein